MDSFIGNITLQYNTDIQKASRLLFKESGYDQLSSFFALWATIGMAYWVEFNQLFFDNDEKEKRKGNEAPLYSI